LLRYLTKREAQLEMERGRLHPVGAGVTEASSTPRFSINY
jgi:hypothetical protein